MSERRRSRRRFLLQESPTSHSATSHEASSLGAGRSFLKFGCQQYEKVEEWPKDFQNSMRDCKGCLGTPCYCTIKDLHWAMSGLRYYWLVTLEPPKNVSFRKMRFLRLRLSLGHSGQQIPVSQLQNGVSTSPLPTFIVDMGKSSRKRFLGPGKRFCRDSMYCWETVPF